jgi:hypothetical protein
LPIGLGVLLLAVAAALAWRGCGFYLLDMEARTEHPDFRLLRPSGTFGHGYGFAAAALVFTNLLYLLRRRGVFQVGSMRGWLDAHVFTGLLAGTLAAVHSAFQLRTPVATVTTGSLLVVVISGIVGRLLHALINRRSEVPLSDRLAALETLLPGVASPARMAIDSYPGPSLPANPSLLRSLLALPSFLRAARDRREVLAVLIGNHRGAAAPSGELGQRIGELLDTAAAELRAAGSAALLSSWRSLHRLFAILMLVTVVVHIAVAWYYGYRWIFT